jgi:shikimate kinase
MSRHVVLIGLPGAGKSTIGRLVADTLKAPFLDIDATIMRKEGRPIEILFAERGEAAFRQIEAQEMDQALAGEASIIAPGGGWAAQPGAIATARDRALLIYLKTRPGTATTRAVPAGNRPALMGEDPELRMRELLREREPFYMQADAQVETDARRPAEIAADVVRLARERGQW